MTTRAQPRITWADEMANTNYELAPLVDEWLLTYESAGKSAGTIRTYRSLVGNMLRWFEVEHGRPCRAADIGDERNGERLVNRYLLNRRSLKREPASLKTILACLRQFTRWLHVQGYVRENTVREVPNVTMNKRMTRIFTEEDKQQIEGYLTAQGERGQRNLTLWRFMLDTGLRREEVANLRVEDAILTDRRGKALRVGRCTVIGKGDKERPIGFGEDVARGLREYARYLRRPATEEDDPYFFLTHQGYRLRPAYITSLFYEWRKALNLDHLHPHTTRHTFATEFLQGGGDLATLKELLGHTNITQTEHYVHLAGTDFLVQQHQHISPVDARRRRLTSGSRLNPARLTTSAAVNSQQPTAIRAQKRVATQ